LEEEAAGDSLEAAGDSLEAAAAALAACKKTPPLVECSNITRIIHEHYKNYT